MHVFPGAGSACPLELHRSFTILIADTDLELNQAGEFEAGDSGLRIANVSGAGQVGLRDTCIEAQGSFHIGGAAEVTWTGNDDGYETNPFPTFEIAGDATGSLLVRNAKWYRPSGWEVNLPATFIARQISREFPDSLFRVVLDGVILYDFPWDVLTVTVDPANPVPPFPGPPPPPTGYLPLTRGVLTEVRDVTLMSRLCVNDSLPLHQDGNCAHGTNVLAAVTRVRPGIANLLAGGVDLAVATLPADPTSCTSGGGWIVGPGANAGAAFHALTSRSGLPRTHGELPSNIQKGMRVPFVMPPTVNSAMRLDSGQKGANLTISMKDAIYVSPAAQLVLSGWVRTNGVGMFTVYSDWQDFGGEHTADLNARWATQFVSTQLQSPPRLGFQGCL